MDSKCIQLPKSCNTTTIAESAVLPQRFFLVFVFIFKFSFLLLFPKLKVAKLHKCTTTLAIYFAGGIHCEYIIYYFLVIGTYIFNTIKVGNPIFQIYRLNYYEFSALYTSLPPPHTADSLRRKNPGPPTAMKSLQRGA